MADHGVSRVTVAVALEGKIGEAGVDDGGVEAFPARSLSEPLSVEETTSVAGAVLSDMLCRVQ